MRAQITSPSRLWLLAGLAVLFISAVGVAAASAVSGTANKNLKTYTHSSGWMVSYPMAWEAGEFDMMLLEWSKHKSGVSFKPPLQVVDVGNGKIVDANPNEAIHEVLVSVELINLPTTDLKVLAKDLKKSFQEKAKAYKVTTSIKSHPTLGKVLYVHFRTKYINTVPAAKLGTADAYYTYMFGFKGKQQITIAFSTDKEGYAKHRKSAKAVMNSFVPKK